MLWTKHSRKIQSQEQTEKSTSDQRILNRFSSIFQCFNMKSQAICLPTWLFSATLPITNGAFDDLIILEFRENWRNLKRLRHDVFAVHLSRQSFNILTVALSDKTVNQQWLITHNFFHCVKLAVTAKDLALFLLKLFWGGSSLKIILRGTFHWSLYNVE